MTHAENESHQLGREAEGLEYNPDVLHCQATIVCFVQLRVVQIKKLKKKKNTRIWIPSMPEYGDIGPTFLYLNF